MLAAFGAPFQQVSFADFPELEPMKTIGQYPGGVIVEHAMMTGMRYATPVAAVVTPLVWQWRRPKRLRSHTAEEISMRTTPMLHVLSEMLALGTVGGAAVGLGQVMWDTPGKYPTQRAVVDEAVRLRQDRTADRWARTTARLGLMGLGMAVINMPGPLWRRAAAGLGGGVLLSAPTSYSDFDLSMDMAF